MLCKPGWQVCYALAAWVCGQVIMHGFWPGIILCRRACNSWHCVSLRCALLNDFRSVWCGCYVLVARLRVAAHSVKQRVLWAQLVVHCGRAAGGPPADGCEGLLQLWVMQVFLYMRGRVRVRLASFTRCSRWMWRAQACQVK
jgi:hypothetical protein